MTTEDTWAVGPASLLLEAREHVTSALEILAGVPMTNVTAEIFHSLRETQEALETLARNVSSADGPTGADLAYPAVFGTDTDD